VDTQKSLLDPSNAGDDANLFNHIRGINTILDNILNQGPALPPPQNPPFRPGTPIPSGPLQQGPTIPQYGLQRGPILNPQEQSTYNRMMQSDLNRQTGQPPGRGGKMRKSRRAKKSTKKGKGKIKGKSRRSKR
jgi:hypothetical protein